MRASLSLARTAARRPSPVPLSSAARAFSAEQAFDADLSGVSFTLNDDQKMIQSMARQFAADVIIPQAAEYDRTMAFPHDIFQEAWELGLVNAHIPEAYGGPGMHTLDGVVIAEELAYGCSGIQTAMEANTLAQMPVILAGNDAQKKK